MTWPRDMVAFFLECHPKSPTMPVIQAGFIIGQREDDLTHLLTVTLVSAPQYYPTSTLLTPVVREGKNEANGKMTPTHPHWVWRSEVVILST